MNHQPYENWILDEIKISPEEKTSLNEHLKECPDCYKLYHSWNKVQVQLRTAPVKNAPSNFVPKWKTEFAMRQKEQEKRQARTLLISLASGGGAKSKLWRQIVSDITGLHQEYVPDAEGAVGCAYVAGIALGWYKDFENLRDWVVVEDVTEPNPDAQAAYEKYYRLFNEMHDYLKPVFQANLRSFVCTASFFPDPLCMDA